MGQALFVQDGNTIDYTPGANVAAGDVLVIGDLVAVATEPIAANQLGALATTGVFDFTKATGAGTNVAAGTLVYWDDAENVAKADSETGANKLIGVVVRAAATTDTTMRVLLRQR